MSNFIVKINNLISQNDLSADLIKSVCDLIATEISSNVSIFDIDFKAIYETTFPIGSLPIGKVVLEKLKNQGYNFNLNDTLISGENFYVCVVPIVAHRERLATLFMYKQNLFSDSEINKIDSVYACISLALSKIYKQQAYLKQSKLNAARISLSSLSFREIEACIAIFKNFDNKEGIINATQISKDNGITKSSIVNALRKLQSASLVECRSLGVKGTYIKVKNVGLIEEIKKY